MAAIGPGETDTPSDVPDVLAIEVANALINGMRQKRIAMSEMTPRLEMALRIQVNWHASRPLIPRAAAIALQYNRRPCDGVFIALAERLDSVRITADAKLVRGLHGTRLALRVRLLG